MFLEDELKYLREQQKTLNYEVLSVDKNVIKMKLGNQQEVELKITEDGYLVKEQRFDTLEQMLHALDPQFQNFFMGEVMKKLQLAM